MQQHHSIFGNFVLAAIVGTVPLWADLFENTSWFATKLAPIICLIVGCLQLYLLIRKLRRR